VDIWHLFQRDQTSVYDVKDYPFFVLSSRQSDFLSFNETVKEYACHFSNYRLVYIMSLYYVGPSPLLSHITEYGNVSNFDLTSSAALPTGIFEHMSFTVL